MTRMLRTAIAALAITLLPLGALAQHGEGEGHGEPAHIVGDEPGGHEDVHPEHGTHEGHAPATFADVDWFEMGGSLVNFGIWLFLIGWALRSQLPPFLRNRRAAVVEGMEESRRLKDEAEAKYKEYADRIENLDAELDRLRAEMKRAGMEERDRIVEEASKKAEAIRADARFLVEQQMKQLREDLTREAIEAAIAAATEILTKSTTAADQERLAREYLDGVVAQIGERGRARTETPS